MKKNNMMKSAVLMLLAAMAINSCSTSKNVNKEIKDENQVARPDNDMDMDEEPEEEDVASEEELDDEEFDEEIGDDDDDL